MSLRTEHGHLEGREQPLLEPKPPHTNVLSRAHPTESFFQPSTLASREDDIEASMFQMFQGKRDLGKGCLLKFYQK